MTAADLDLGNWRSAWESMPALVVVVRGPQATLVYQNARSRAVLGERPLGVPIDEAFPEAFAQEGARTGALERVRLTGTVLELPRAAVDVRDVTGDRLVLQYVLAPYGSGPPHEGVVIMVSDVTAEARAEQAAARAHLLARVSEGVDTATDPDQALQFLTDTLVPAVADIAAVFVTGPASRADGLREPVPPVAMTLDADLVARLGPPPPGEQRSAPAPWEDAMEAGRTVLIDLRQRDDREAVTPGARSWLEQAEVSTVAVLPLVVAGELAGAVVLAAADGRTPYTDDDLPFLEDLAARVGAAVAHLRSVRQQWQVALDLQRVLLPSAVPALPGVDVACRYAAGSPEVDVGGDWWDITHLGGGRVGIGVGDVSGRGVLAAAVMGQARAAMRAAAHADLPPGQVLTLLDTQVTELVTPPPMTAGDTPPPRFATAVYGVLDPFDETLRLASAGHPPLLVRAPDGTVHRAEPPPGPPLGLDIGPFEEIVCPFPAGSLLAAFTDGLVESRDRELDDGIALLAAELAGVQADDDLDAVADRLLTVVRTDGQDDVALVLLRLTPAAAPSARIEGTLHHLREVSSSRREVAAMARTAMPDREDEVVQVTSELLANAVEHGGAPVRLRAHVTSGRLVVEATDTSALVPRPTTAAEQDERGRGLAIVAALADRWGVRISRQGKVTWAEFRHPGPAGGSTASPRP